MANRIVLLVSVVLAGVASAATSGSAAPAADDCLAKPKGPAPAGKHWYYRTNREIKRKCWFLADEGERTAAVTPPKQATTPPKQSVSAPPVDPGQKADTRLPAANARAELIDEPQSEQPSLSAAPRRPEPKPVLQAQPQREASALPDGSTRDPIASARASTPANTPTLTIASRWPVSSDAFTPDRETMVSNPVSASQAEKRSPVLAAISAGAAETPSVTVDSSGGTNFAHLALAFVFVAIGSGAIFMFLAPGRQLRRHSISERRVASSVMHRNEMPRTRFGTTIATGPAADMSRSGPGR